MDLLVIGIPFCEFNSGHRIGPTPPALRWLYMPRQVSLECGQKRGGSIDKPLVRAFIAAADLIH
jgi:hypothetical protein